MDKRVVSYIIADTGLHTTYDGETYKTSFEPLNVKSSYRIGEMICEVTRSRIKDLSQKIESCPYCSLKISKDSLGQLFLWVREGGFMDEEEYLISVFATSTVSSFIERLREVDKPLEELSKMLVELSRESEDNKKLVCTLFEKGMDKNFKLETVHDVLLSGYYLFLVARNQTIKKFEEYLAGQMDDSGPFGTGAGPGRDYYLGINENNPVINSMIICEEGRFLQSYSMKSLSALLRIEAFHIQEKKVKVVRCKNCGSFFVPQNRSDTIYCNNPSPQDPTRSCKKMGAQITRISMEKQDAATRKYRKLYLNNNMRMKRHPENTEYKELHDKMIQGAKEWRKRLKDNPELYSEFEKWVDGLEQIN